MEIKRIDDKCTVKQSATGRAVEAEILDFKEKKSMVVVLNKDVKLPMVWNGRLYEGKMAGLDFTSAGPKINITSTGR